jgi:hypothetical protein
MLNPNSHWIGHIGLPFFQANCKKNIKCNKILEISWAGKSSDEFFSIKGVPLKTPFHVCFIRAKPRNPKGVVGLIGQPL